METVDYTMKVPKEMKEVVDLLDGLLEKIMSKAGASSYMSLLDELMAAIDGVGGIAEEAKSQYRDEAAGYLVHKLLGRLLPVAKSESPPELD